MRTTLYLAALLQPLWASAQNSTSPARGPLCACSQLSALNASNYVAKDSTDYQTENLKVWDKRSNQSPACIYLPTTADDAAEAVSILNSCNAVFALRGGGHMNYPGSNNIDGGVLLSLNRMDELQLSNDTETVAIGPGNRWIDVYSYLEPFGKYVIGGRLKVIGVPGLTLIGGVNYFINKYGFSMDNVVNYDVILGNGTQVKANRQENPDLFWALKGGGSNFGLVSRFTFKTLPIANASTTISVWGPQAIEPFIRAVCKFVDNIGNKPSVAAGGVLNINYNATTGVSTANFFGSQEGTESPASSFAPFAKLPGILQKRDAVTTPAKFSANFDSPAQMFRIQFGHHTIRTDPDRLISIYNQWVEALQDIRDVPGLQPTFVLNPAPKSAARVAKKNGVGNVWGLDDKENYIWWQLSTAWANPEDDIRVTSWSKSLLERLHRENIDMGIGTEFLYSGDASESQDVYATLPEKNRDRLFDVRDRYDVDGVFQRLNYGGFKLGY
ncbi:FAD binding domain-containing protein [Elsinoe ampelina]|uniref:FAD binding domain-containing protein n=1 Tax=Elsinoe ampelina TaxID=302913 RepID=A0A6A6G1S2_9PEZI|nr:FAD binding domain-containing protein [Elsinoe ampelina]